MKTDNLNELQDMKEALSLLKHSGFVFKIRESSNIYNEFIIAYRDTHNYKMCVPRIAIDTLFAGENKNLVIDIFCKAIEQKIERLKPLATQEIYEMMNIVGGAK